MLCIVLSIFLHYLCVSRYLDELYNSYIHFIESLSITLSWFTRLDVSILPRERELVFGLYWQTSGANERDTETIKMLLRPRRVISSVGGGQLVNCFIVVPNLTTSLMCVLICNCVCVSLSFALEMRHIDTMETTNVSHRHYEMITLFQCCCI